jgi:hypothetical protein
MSDFNVEEAKASFNSKTIQGSVVALLGAFASPALAQLGIEDLAAQAAIWDNLVIAVGAVYAIYGRFAAAGKVKLL